MTAIRIDGLDVYQDVGGALTQGSMAGSGFSLFSNGGTQPITAQAGVTAKSLAFQFTRANSYYSNMIYSFASSADTVVIGFAMKGSTRASLFRLNGVLTIDWTANGPLALNGTEGPNTIVLGRWYYLELVIDKGAGRARLFVNDVEFVSIAMPGALASATDWSASFGWQSSGTGGSLLVDDLVVVDSANTSDGITARLGPVENLTILPTSVTVDEFDNPTTQTPVEVVSGIPPVEGRYLESSTAGDRELFTGGDLNDERDVLAFTAMAVLSKTDLDDRQMGIQIVDATGVQEQVFDVGLTFAYQQVTRAVDSGGAPWSIAKINAAQWGAVIRP